MQGKIYAPDLLESDIKLILSAFSNQQKDATELEIKNTLAQIYNYKDFEQFEQERNNGTHQTINSLSTEERYAVDCLRKIIISDLLERHGASKRDQTKIIYTAFDNITGLKKLSRLLGPKHEIHTPMQLSNDALKGHVIICNATLKQCSESIKFTALPNLAANGGLLVLRESVLDRLLGSIFYSANAFNTEINIINATDSTKYRAVEIQTLQQQLIEINGIDPIPMNTALSKNNLVIIVTPDLPCKIDLAVQQLIRSFKENTTTELYKVESSLPSDALVSSLMANSYKQRVLKPICIDHMQRFVPAGFATIVAQSRLFGLMLVGSISEEHYISEIAKNELTHIAANTTTNIVFNLSHDEKVEIERLFQKQTNQHFPVRILTNISY